MINKELLIIKRQIIKVLNITQVKREQYDHNYFKTLQEKLEKLLADFENGEVNKNILQGSVKAYLETGVSESYSDSLIKELDKLEVMLTFPS
ncbi:hypothetical protein [Virgibacillus halodenitrificans]|uniref:hypothetical protein n=1 Tax=Virgibacillus halodenitrificans TaxID=1482 RepID=UPI002DB71F20|nr:hypothetical protein [Virgibacillus halodenitrificans]MEC2159692.1 hypothetical protein [Virgibacillus halodenitrificans]